MEQLQRVKHLIDNANESQNHLIFLDRHGEIDVVSMGPKEPEQKDSTDDCVRLLQVAGIQSGGPYFQILSIHADGRIFTGSDSEEYSFDAINDDLLRAAIENADAERDRFYAERAEVFGPSAYPA